MVKKIINIISTVILVVLIVFVVILFVIRASGKTPTIFGYQVSRVLTGSMEPELMKGDVILIKSVPPSEIKEGDIITFRSREGEMRGQTITHRVVKEPVKENGTYFFQTQGDQNSIPDDVIEDSQVQGKYIKKLSLIDKMYSFFFTPYGIITFVFIIVALFGYEIISLIISYKSLDEDDEEYYEPKAKKESKKRKKPKKTHIKKSKPKKQPKKE